MSMFISYTMKSLPERLADAGAPGVYRYDASQGGRMVFELHDGTLLTPGEAEARFLAPAPAPEPAEEPDRYPVAATELRPGHLVHDEVRGTVETVCHVHRNRGEVVVYSDGGTRPRTFQPRREVTVSGPLDVPPHCDHPGIEAPEESKGGRLRIWAEVARRHRDALTVLEDYAAAHPDLAAALADLSPHYMQGTDLTRYGRERQLFETQQEVDHLSARAESYGA